MSDPADTCALVEVVVEHFIGLDSPLIRQLATLDAEGDGYVCRLYRAPGDLLVVSPVEPPARGASLLDWASSCVQQTVSSVGDMEQRPCFGGTTVELRVAGAEVRTLSFGTLVNRMCDLLDASACESLWDVVCLVLRSGLTHAQHELRPWVVALDLEGTLISNAVSVFPRPGLRRFLDGCSLLPCRPVAFTSVDERRFRDIACLLVDEGSAPAWFSEIPYVHWTSSKKDLTFIEGADMDRTLLIDDMEQYVCDVQCKQWVEVKGYEPPFDRDDRELDRVLREIARRTVTHVVG